MESVLATGGPIWASAETSASLAAQRWRRGSRVMSWQSLQDSWPARRAWTSLGSNTGHVERLLLLHRCSSSTLVVGELLEEKPKRYLCVIEPSSLSSSIPRVLTF